MKDELIAMAETLKDWRKYGYDKFSAEAQKIIDELSTGQDWISTDEVLPLSGKVLASFVNECGKRRTIVAEYIHPRTVQCCDWYSHEAEFEPDYDEEKDIEWVKAGWVEHVENWDDFSAVDVYREITHWMPLPSAPK